MMKGHQAIAAALKDHGIDVIFGLMGNANLHYLVDWIDSGGRYVRSVQCDPAIDLPRLY